MQYGVTKFLFVITSQIFNEGFADNPPPINLANIPYDAG